MSSGLVVVIPFYTEVILCMLQLVVAEFQDCHKIVLPFRYFRFPTLDQIYLRIVARCVSQMFWLILFL